MSGGSIDLRAWLLWAMAASLPALLGRNPFPLLASLIAVLAVRQVWRQRSTTMESFAPVWKLSVLFVSIGMLFNALMVRSGDRVLLRLPDEWPLVGGAITANAVLFGMLSGLALVTLVLIGLTVASVLDWAMALRLIPRQMIGLAVAGSIALAFVPQSFVAFREIREAQALRGYETRRLRDVGPLLVPLLTGGLERAMTLAETLESRAFGAAMEGSGSRRRMARLGPSLAIAVICIGVYLLALGRGLPAVLSLIAGVVGFSLAARAGATGLPERTRYRSPSLDRRDAIVIGGALLALASMLLALTLDPATLRFDPYPVLQAPKASPWLLLGLLGLFGPAVVGAVGPLRPVP